MAGWDKKYFITELREQVGFAPWTPDFAGNEAMRLLSMDDEVVKGGFYMETAWFWPGDWPKTKSDEGTVKEHAHEFDEAVAYVGTDPDNPYELNGEVEFWIDGKKNVIDKSFIAFVPAGTKHGPLKINRIDKPIFHFTAGMQQKYLG